MANKHKKIYDGITDKQKQARIKNFTKGRLKGALAAIEYAMTSKNVDLTPKCVKYLEESHLLIYLALKKEWDK